MRITLENGYTRVEIKELGAELCSFYSKTSGFEYLWQGDPMVWSGQSPLLFPIVGGLLNGKYHYKGKDYQLAKHGFARNSLFKCERKTDDSAIFLLESNESTMDVYPFSFALSVEFKLSKNQIRVKHRVKNKSGEQMYFSIGAHPGFNCEIGDYLEFEKNETLFTERIDKNAVIIDTKFPLLNDERILKITENLFDNDALILSGFKSKQVTLKSPGHSRELRFHFGDAPFLGIWAKPGASYVCIEPWYGINDDYSLSGDLVKKRGIQTLNPEDEFAFEWSAQIFEPQLQQFFNKK
ncbi:MAG: aldose 1-epimerase family protein [Acutalibacteraceae bacterium]|jgi:galactose mutarotase-like enzyme